MRKHQKLLTLALMIVLSSCDEPGSKTEYKFSADIKYQEHTYTLTQNITCTRKLTLSEADLIPRYEWQSSGAKFLAIRLAPNNTAFYKPKITCQDGVAREIPQYLAVIDHRTEVAKLYLIEKAAAPTIAALINTRLEKRDGQTKPDDNPNAQVDFFTQTLKDFPTNFTAVEAKAILLDAKTIADVSLNYYKGLSKITLAGSETSPQASQGDNAIERFPFSVGGVANAKTMTLGYNGDAFEIPRMTQEGIRVFYASPKFGMASETAVKHKILVQYKDVRFELNGLQELYDPELNTVYVFKATRAGKLSDLLNSLGNSSE